MDSKNNLWIGTDSGLYLQKEGKLYKYTSCTRENIVSSKIHDIFQSKNNLLWIGTDKGYSYFNLNSSNFISFKNSKEHPVDAWSINMDMEKNLLIASRTDGLVRLKKNKEEVLLNEIVNVVRHKNNIIYAGTRYKGLFILDKNAKILKEINENTYLENKQVRTLYIDNRENVYIGTDLGLFLYNRDRDVLVEILNENFINHRITNIISDKNNKNELWLGVFGKGLVNYNTQTGKVKVYDYLNGEFFQKIWALYDTGGYVYINVINLRNVHKKNKISKRKYHLIVE